MSTVMSIASVHPTLRTLAIGAHGVLAAYLLVNGVGHQGHVLYKALAGTLPAGSHLPSLLAIGAGLIASGAVVAFGVGPLRRVPAPSFLPAYLGVGLLAVVLGGTALAYGTRFLWGSITLGSLDLALLTALAVLHGRA